VAEVVPEWVQELDVDLVAQAAVEMAERKFRQYQEVLEQMD
jgi:hypothetical protein|tara:strand:- start:121 stop:243 length:123 start_codon:yes stop_codon:yes gene_type:complete